MACKWSAQCFLGVGKASLRDDKLTAEGRKTLSGESVKAVGIGEDSPPHSTIQRGLTDVRFLECVTGSLKLHKVYL